MPNYETHTQVQEPNIPVDPAENQPVPTENGSGGVAQIKQAVSQSEKKLRNAIDEMAGTGLMPISRHYQQIIQQCSEKVLSFLKQIKIAPAGHVIDEAILTIIQTDALLKKHNEKNQTELKAGLKKAFEQWEQAWIDIQKEVPANVSYSIDASDLQPKADDNKTVRKYKSRRRFFRFGRSKVKTEVPVRNILHHFREVAVKPDLHRKLGEFTMRSYQLQNDLRKELSRQLKLLVISLDKTDPSEQSDIVQERIKVFADTVNQFQKQSEALTTDFRQSATKAISEAMNEAGRLALTPGASDLLRQREKRVNHSTLEVLIARMKQFPEVWEINQQAFNRQLHAELWFARMSLIVFRLARNSRITVEREFFNPVEENIQSLENSLEQMKQRLEKKKSGDEPTKVKLNDQLYLSAEGMIGKLENTTDAVAQVLPEDFELLHVEDDTSPVTFTRKLPTTKIALSRISDYLVKTNFTQSHRKELLDMSQQVKQINNRVINSANLIAYSLEIAAEDQQHQIITETIEKTTAELEEVKAALNKTRSAFGQQLVAAQNNTLASLDVKAVVNRADQLQQYVSRDTSERPVNQWMEKRMRRVNNLWRKLGLFIVRRRHDVVVARHQKKHERLVNDGERIQNFVESLQLSPEIDQQLPYYYKQLFSGKHLSNASGVRIRKNEISQAKKVIGRIQRGSGGALAITGDAMTGMTFLTNYIATQLITGKIFRISAPPGGSHKEIDLHKAIMDQVGKKRGNVISSLASLEPGCVFIFHDLEQWWLKHEGGDEAIKALAQIIDRFGRKFYFLLTCNSFSFRLISKVGSLENYLTSTLVIAPATLDEMREIIWLRHTTGGMEVEISGKKAENFHGKHWDALFKKFYKRSNGNIGLALHFWLLSIVAVKGETVVIEDTGLESFPQISNSNWKVLIYQLFLHRTLSLTRLKLMFEDEDPQWLRQNLAALIRFGLVEETGRHSYSLSIICRPYIERWFNEMKLI